MRADQVPTERRRRELAGDLTQLLRPPHDALHRVVIGEHGIRGVDLLLDGGGEQAQRLGRGLLRGKGGVVDVGREHAVHLADDRAEARDAVQKDVGRRGHLFEPE